MNKLLDKTILNTPTGLFQIHDLLNYTGPVYTMDSTGCIVCNSSCYIERSTELIEIYRLRLTNGIFIIASKDTKLLTSTRGYIEIENLNTDDFIICSDLDNNKVQEIEFIATNYTYSITSGTSVLANNIQIYSADC
jgi:intein/homing endonuclease